MDVGSVADSLALASTASRMTVGVMSAAQSLEKDLVSRLFGSMGIGNAVDAYA